MWAWFLADVPNGCISTENKSSKGREQKGEKSKLTNSLVTFPGMVVTTWASLSSQWIQLIYFPVGLASSQLVVSFFSGFFSVSLAKARAEWRRDHWGNFIRKASATKGHWHDTGPFSQRKDVFALLAHWNGHYCFFLMHLLVNSVLNHLKSIINKKRMDVNWYEAFLGTLTLDSKECISNW